MTKKILMVLTSHDRLGETGKKTGYWLEELAAPYFAFRDAGLEVTLASPKGGRPPADPGSEAEDSQTAETRRFTADGAAQAQLGATLPLAEVEAGDYDAIFYPGGHGPLWDLVDDAQSIALIQAFWAQDKVVG
ncbi:MAG: type 1 glutamine amidotransferase domain-containing protein, partial [Pseudomonadota bacterium]